MLVSLFILFYFILFYFILINPQQAFCLVNNLNLLQYQRLAKLQHPYGTNLESAWFRLYILLQGGK
jgi:hypothetical protein